MTNDGRDRGPSSVEGEACVVVRFASYDLFNMYGSDDSAERARFDRVIAVIQGLRADVLAVQEVIADADDPSVKATLAGRRLRELAGAVQMRCEFPDGRVACGVGDHHRFHTGLLWAPHITPVGGFATYTGANTWHSLVTSTFDVGGRVPMRHTSYHAPPFGRYRRADEAERVLAVMTRPDDRPPGLIGADWNSVSADRLWRASSDRDEPGRWVLYDPDPYRGAWHGDLSYQTRWTGIDTDGQPWFHADREPGGIRYHGGLRDAAAALGAPWRATSGHWPDDPYGPRRIDAIRITPEIVPALRSYQVAEEPVRRVDPMTASDHLPVHVDYDPAAIEPRHGSPRDRR